MWAAGAIQTRRGQARDARLVFFVVASTVTMLMIGLRFEVGGDWVAYMRTYEDIVFLTLPNALQRSDPAYGALNWLSAQFDLGVTPVNLICGGLFTGGVARLAWKQPNPALAMLVAVPYLIIVVAMGYTRQAAAIGIVCFAIADASNQKLVRLVSLIGIAALFHKTAILILPIALVPILRRNFIFGFIGAVLFISLFVLILRDSSDRLITNYVQGDYDSQGAMIRVSMNVLAAGIFIAFRTKFEIEDFQKSFWMVCSILSIGSVAIFFVASATSGLDRISLYFIPLQLVTFSRLPQILGRGKAATNPSILILIIFYCVSVQFVWLNYASHAENWVPYSINI
ncbi:EpsG family protein [Sphingomonas sp. PB4P5]|uniref:EpsG family protein n=1 Tax=Parasphingomonas puruogangriensis TaxID=3096155 RepID=UPI002FCB7B4E